MTFVAHTENWQYATNNAMTKVRNQTDRQKMNRTTISVKPYLLFFAKAKEKQFYPRANASCFTFAFTQTLLKLDSKSYLRFK